MQATLQETTSVIIIKDSDPLCVDTNTLTENSPVFTKIFTECGFEEHDMTDFDPAAVRVFLTLLADKKMEDIEPGMFREVHKMAVTFEVDWLRQDCARWMEKRIIAAGGDNLEKFTYCFEESYYALKRLEIKEFMECFIDRYGLSYDITNADMIDSPEYNFMMQYLKDFDKMDKEMICPLLQLGGVNCKLFLDAIKRSVANNLFLSDNTLHLLKNINLKVCFHNDWQQWSNMFDEIGELPEISTEDFKITQKLLNDAWRSVHISNSSNGDSVGDIENAESEKILLNRFNIHFYLWYPEKRSSDVFESLGNGKIKSMFEVLFWSVKYLSQEENDHFISTMEELSKERHIKKVTWYIIDDMADALKHSPRDGAKTAISNLMKIRQSKLLSAPYRETVVIDIWESEPVGTKKRECKLIFKFKHSAIGTCTLPGECGFIIKRYKHKDGNLTFELMTNSEYYVNTGVHYHNAICSRDILCLYQVYELTLKDGTKLYEISTFNKSVLQYFWDYWLPNITKREYKTTFIVYNVSDYMMAK